MNDRWRSILWTALYAFAWFVAVVAMGIVLGNAWVCYNSGPLRPPVQIGLVAETLAAQSAGPAGCPLGSSMQLAVGVEVATCGTFAPDQPRNDGNPGHTLIDFGGQWVMGRMLVEGHGHDLYDRKVQREVVTRNYPAEDEVPVKLRPPKDAKYHDADELMRCFMGSDNETNDGRCVGGPLYPPVHALLYYPLALLEPHWAYRAMQILHLVLVVVCGLAVRQISEGRIWLPVAITAIVVYPGFRGSIILGQNPIVTLTILSWGWALIARGKTGWGGIVWGLLAFKPVWALAFFLVPVLTRRWRTCLGMIATGTLLAAATLPLVGLQSWMDWVKVGRMATEIYNTDENWIHLSRDLLGIPRRWLVDFSPDAVRDPHPLLTAILGWILVVTVLAATAILALIRRKQSRLATGPPVAFLLLGGWLTCFHFMYYDVLLTALPMCLLWTEPRRYLERSYIAIMPLTEPLLGKQLSRYYRLSPAEGSPLPIPSLHPVHANLWVLNCFVPTLMLVLLFLEFGTGPLHVQLPELPWETFCFISLWLWCGWRWIRMKDEGSRMEDGGWRKEDGGSRMEDGESRIETMGGKLAPGK